MREFVHKSKLIILLLLLYSQICLAQDNYFATLNNVKSRTLAMGGAFTSMNDDLESVYYNPAAFTVYANKKNFRLTFFLNPISSAIAFKEHTNKFQDKINSDKNAATYALLTIAAQPPTRE